MWYKYLADAVLVIHLFFILFVLFGAFLVYRWHRLMWLHIPMALWGMLISLLGWVCPLTPLENYLRRMAGQEGYAGGFIGHYLLPIIYPGELTRVMAIEMGVFVFLWNSLIYYILLYKWKNKHKE